MPQVANRFKPQQKAQALTDLGFLLSDKRGAKVDDLHLTPLALIDRIAALVPPPAVMPLLTG